MRAKILLPLVTLALLLSGCAISRSPRGYRADAEHMQNDLRGSWTVVKTLDRSRIQGELLAVNADSLYLLTAEQDLRRLAWGEVDKARLEAWKTRTGSLLGWQAAGTALAVGHGWWGLITLPLWHLTGSAVTGSYTFDPILKVPGKSWADLQPFARFPGGLPVGLRTRDLHLLPAEDHLVETRPLTFGEAQVERNAALLSRQEAFERGAGTATPRSRVWQMPTAGPAGLPGAWVRGEFASGFGPRLVAGELLAVEGRTLHLWSNGVRQVDLGQLAVCGVFTAAAGSTVLARVGDMVAQDPQRFQSLAAYPKGMPSDAQLQQDRRLLEKEKPAAWRYLTKKSRWPK